MRKCRLLFYFVLTYSRILLTASQSIMAVLYSPQTITISLNYYQNDLF